MLHIELQLDISDQVNISTYDDIEYLNCFLSEGLTVSQFIANICLHLLITIIVHIMMIIIIANASTIRQYSCIYHTCTIISCLIIHDNLRYCGHSKIGSI